MQNEENGKEKKKYSKLFKSKIVLSLYGNGFVKFMADICIDKKNPGQMRKFPFPLKQSTMET